MNNLKDSVTPTKGRPLILAAIMLALFLGALDQTVVGTALPRIVTDLGGSSLYTWVVSSYLLSSTITVPIYGKFSDVFGRKPMLLTGIVLFLLGSALSGQSQNMAELIIFRGVQGLGAGALFPIALAVIGDLFTPRERGRYQGLFGAVFGVSFLIGPFIGGFLTDNVSWRWIFYVNLPFGLLALTVVSIVLHNHRAVAARARDLDYAGIVVFTAGVIPLLIGLTNKGGTDASGQLNSWLSFSVGGLLAIGVVLLALFFVIERFAQHPIIPLYLFKERTIAASNFAVFMVSFGLFSAIIFMPRYYQVVESVSATQSGYMVWPLLVGLIGASIGTGIVISRTGRYKAIIVIAMALVAVGGFLMTRLETNTPTPMLWLWLFALGLGVGPSMSAFTVIIQNVAARKDLGVATGTMTFLRQIGGSLGLALAGTIFNLVLTNQMSAHLVAAGVPAQIAAYQSQTGDAAQHQLCPPQNNDITAVGSLQETLTNNLNSCTSKILYDSSLTAEQKQQATAQIAAVRHYIPNIVSGIRDDLSESIGTVFWMVVIAAGLALIAVFWIREVPLRTHLHGTAEAADIIPGAEVPV